jgi:hypothetical protein
MTVTTQFRCPERITQITIFLSSFHLIINSYHLIHRQKCEGTRQDRSSDQRAQGAQGAREARSSSDHTPQKSKQL